jgi:hypothetical protein
LAPYRLVLSQLLLERVRRAVEQEQPPSAWQADFRAFIDNQSKLVAETKDMPSYPLHNSLSKFSREDTEPAEGLGIALPGTTVGMSSPADVMRETASIIMFGDASPHFCRIKPQYMTCPCKLDPNYGKIAVTWLELSLAHIARHDRRYGERETMRALRELAKTLALLGRTEEGIAKLQCGLDAHPKSDEFKDTEELLRDLPGAAARLVQDQVRHRL